MEEQLIALTPHQVGSTRVPATTTALGTLAALGGTSLVLVAARAADLELVVTPPGQSPGAVPYTALLAAVVVSGVAALVAALVPRRLRRASRWFTGLSTLAVIGSFASPFGPSEETSTAAVLRVMHVIVALTPARAPHEAERAVKDVEGMTAIVTGGPTASARQRRSRCAQPARTSS